MKEDVDQLRNMIREMQLYWLDEELDEIISAGKLQTKEIKEGRKKSFRGVEQVPFTYEEQLEIIITTLKNYFIVLPEVQEDTNKRMNENLGIKKLSFKEPDGLEFNQIDVRTQKLDMLLSQIKG